MDGPVYPILFESGFTGRRLYPPLPSHRCAPITGQTNLSYRIFILMIPQLHSTIQIVEQ